MTVKFSVAMASAAASAYATTIGSGASLEIRSGSKPATPETAASGTLLVTIPITGSFTASGATITSADPAAASPVAAGTAGHFRLKTSGGTAVIDGDVSDGSGSGDLKLGNTSIQTGVPVELGVITITVPVS